MKKVIVLSIVVIFGIAVYAKCCNCCKETVVTNRVYSETITVATNKVCGCICNCNLPKVESVTVKEYTAGNSILGVEMTIIKETVPPPPPPPTCEVWIEGCWGCALRSDGTYIQRWIPGHYEKCLMIQ